MHPRAPRVPAMIRRLRAHLSFANVTSSLALFVALGGVGYAATQLPKNSVGPKQIRKGAIGKSELRSRAVTPRKLSRGARRRLTGEQGPPGAAGAPGAPGARGPQGPAGAPATTLFAAVSHSGALLHGSGAESATPIAEGNYRVTFDRDLTGCVPLANVGTDVTSPRPAAPSVTRMADGRTVHVYLENSDGAADDRAFYLAVFC